MVQHHSANAEAMGSNPVEVLKCFLVLFSIAQIAITTAMIISSFKICIFAVYIIYKNMR